MSHSYVTPAVLCGISVFSLSLSHSMGWFIDIFMHGYIFIHIQGLYSKYFLSGSLKCEEFKKEYKIN